MQKMNDQNINNQIEVEVLYALPHEQTLLKVQVPQGCAVAEAINISGIREKYPAMDPAKNKLGIFGKLSKADAILRDRDRIEIYRPLIADPKEIRRQRVKEGKVMTAEGSLRSSGVPIGGVNSAPASAGSGLPTFGVPLAGAKGGGEIIQGA